jgi:hypothetical protein
VETAFAEAVAVVFSLRATTAVDCDVVDVVDAVDVAGASGCARSGVETSVVPCAFVSATVVCGWLRPATAVERVDVEDVDDADDVVLSLLRATENG